MKEVKKGRGLKIFLGICICLVVILGVFSTLLFFNSSYTIPKVKVSASLVDKIREGQKQGNVIEINKEELNQVISMYFKEKSSGNIRVKGVQGDIVSNNLKLNVPVIYKGVSLLMTSEGYISSEDNKIQYKPLYFKLGKISIPNSFVFNILKDRLNKGIYVENQVICVDKTIIPIGIKSLQIKENKILISVEKINISLEDKLKSISGASKSKEGNNAAGGSTAGNSQTKESNSLEDTSASSNSSSNNKNVSEMNAALDRISGGLSSAMDSCSTGGQKAVISQMISAANSMKGNLNANPYSYAGGVRASYNSLSPQEKAELKSAVFSNVNGNDVNIISKMLGK